VQLDVIGAGPAYSDRPDAIGSSYLLRSGDSSLLLDLGQGAFARLAARIEPSGLSAVAISHLHPDHFIDLVPLRHYLRYEFDPQRRVRVLAPRELGKRLDSLWGEPGFAAGVFEYQAQAPGECQIEHLSLESARVRHTGDSYGMRVSVGSRSSATRGLVYSGDCGRAADLAPLILPGDDLLCEVSFGPGPAAPGAEHLDGPAVGALAASTNVGRLFLTHLQMGFDPDETLASVRAEFKGPVRFVWPGDQLEL